METIRVSVSRGPLVESEHRVHAVLADTDGKVLARAGEPERRTYWRSAAKPLQALPFLAVGGPTTYDLTPADVAVMCASHHGEPAHVRQVQHILAAADLSEESLQCGVHPPLDKAAALRLEEAGEPPSAVHNNCSGKHAGMLAHTRLLGADLSTYLHPSHPVQRRILEVVSAFSGVAEEDVRVGADGCGVPVFGLPLTAMARAYALLAVPDVADALRLSFTSDVGGAAKGVAHAMKTHPHLIAGTGSLNTEVQEALASEVVVKGGAEGVYSLGHSSGWGLLIKVEDGAQRASGPCLVEILLALGLISEDDERWQSFRTPTVTNHAGREVGEIRVHLPPEFMTEMDRVREEFLRG